ncbi:MAG: PRC-barrel domain-containing protein [Gammaproteobacteria bacterium]|nr:PRC-barrel domain-containing protein [Gammaproteobacteria bacterium]
MDKHSEKIVRTKDVIGVEVKNRADEKLGKIDEIVMDKITGQINYVVLECGGVLGVGSKLFALPWNAIQYDKEEKSFLANIDKERLKNATGFNKDHWPDTADSTTFTKYTETV